MRYIGTTVRGIRTPIIKEGDNLTNVVVSSLIRASEIHKFKFNNKDVVGITEAVVSIAQGNFVTLEVLVNEIHDKFPTDVGVVFPILSRNRFATILKAISMASKRVYMLLSYPADEVGNHLMDKDRMFDIGLNPYTDSFNEKRYRELFGKKVLHRFTGIDYVDYYKSFGDNIEIYFSNDPSYILNFTKNILVSDIHTRFETYKILKKSGAKSIYSLTDICANPSQEHGYNEQYGLLGSNKMGEEKLKLFPRDCEKIVLDIQHELKKRTSKNIEVLIYGDGAFKDPVGGIWELADPVVSPGFTKGLKGQPKEVKLKYIVDNWDGKGNIKDYISKKMKQKQKEKKLEPDGNSLGTTPRQFTDLLGSLCDLTSGSGDKGTPVVLIQGYFDDLLEI